MRDFIHTSHRLRGLPYAFPSLGGLFAQHVLCGLRRPPEAGVDDSPRPCSLPNDLSFENFLFHPRSGLVNAHTCRIQRHDQVPNFEGLVHDHCLSARFSFVTWTSLLPQALFLICPSSFPGVRPCSSSPT
ncbi:hypothetical protein DENSPDRAFT_523445 [Dentipellis sp. KUC8613]|nr:hypothetical protein DENSPDRAFT_523445 [Dentipellis sp. KUC8613]